MKITMIHGQNHQGSTCRMGRLLVSKLGPGHEVREFFLPRDLNHFCTGCCRCIDDESRCPYYSEKRIILDAVDEADLLIFTTPTYCMRASSPMKAFLDLTFTYWMSHRPRAAMFSKKAVILSTAAGVGTGSAIKDISNAMRYWGIPWVRSYGIAIQAASWEEISPNRMRKIEKATDSLAKNVLCQKVRVGFMTKFLFNMMGAMHRSYADSSLEKQYWKDLGWLDKERPWK